MATFRWWCSPEQGHGITWYYSTDATFPYHFLERRFSVCLSGLIAPVCEEFFSDLLGKDWPVLSLTLSDQKSPSRDSKEPLRDKRQTQLMAG